MTLAFWLGTHMPGWLAQTDVPLFVSRRTLSKRRRLPAATTTWALDSGAFTEMQGGGWSISTEAYAAEVLRYRDEIGGLVWVATMDWLCAPVALEATGLSLAEHQQRTVATFVDLRQQLGQLVVPVLQGWEPDDYLRCAEQYEAAGVALDREMVVGVGSIVRGPSGDGDALRVLRAVAPLGLRVHGFGVRGRVLRAASDVLASADSLAWSLDARWDKAGALPGCTHKSCANCLRYALRWRARTLAGLHQERLFIDDEVGVA